jgi:ring-1,2-phenylacetyl-CoA epoxidase subunit PaaE
MLKFHRLKIKSTVPVAEDALCITFELPSHLREDYRFKAGQHVTVRLPGAEDVRRSYSIVSPADSEDLSIGVRVLPNGRVSSFLAEQAKPGESLDVLTPNGSFHTRIEPQRAKRYVMFAAGSGITPMMSIAATVLAAEPRSTIILFYGNRNSASIMFREEILALKNRYMSRFTPYFLLSREPQDIELFNGRLDEERVRLFSRSLFDPANVDEYFICGPGTMVEDLRKVLRELGGTAKIHTELFTTTTAADNRGPVVRSAERLDTTKVTVVMDGRRKSFKMGRDEFVLDAAARAGLELPYSCRAGVCSTCRAKLVSGEVKVHHNVALEDWELADGYILCCQATPTTDRIELSYDQ